VTALRPFMTPASQYDVRALRADWMWLVPASDTPLFISIFGDWIFGRPDGSLWALTLLEGNYEQIAQNATEYNALKNSLEWLDATFIAGWQEIAARKGLEPARQECLGWKIHPMIGGKFEVENLAIFDMGVYQSIMGQLHRQMHDGATRSPGGP
jgi:hypothetical protein